VVFQLKINLSNNPTPSQLSPHKDAQESKSKMRTELTLAARYATIEKLAKSLDDRSARL
jgi:hypothetical protein